MQNTLRGIVVAVGAIFMTSSLSLGAQATAAPDAGAPPTQQHAKTAKTRKRTAKKRARKKTTPKKPAAQPQ
jgi:hypothetical protein